MLTDSDRALGHRLAGDWLERAGETEALVVLEHFDKGSAPDRAVPWWVRAAENALEASDFASALALARRGAAHAFDDEPLGALRLVEAEALRWQGHLTESEARSRDAMSLLVPGSPRWGQAAAERALVHQRLGNATALAELGRELVALSQRTDDESLDYAMVRTAIGLRLTGERELSARLLLGFAVERASPRCRAYLHLCQALDALHTGDLATYLEEEERTRDWFEQAGDTRRALNESGSIGFALLELGEYEAAERTLSLALITAKGLGLEHVVAASLHNLGLVYAHLGRFDEARAAESRALETFRAQNDRRLEGAALTYLARIHQLAGELEAADDAAEQAALLVREVAKPILPLALATLAAVRRSRGQPDAALTAARDAMATLESSGGVETGEALVRLELARALAATGAVAQAAQAFDDAERHLIGRARRIRQPEHRRSFLERVPENADTIARRVS
jgi:tetratricopeptide (TPR) repeat protein